MASVGFLTKDKDHDDDDMILTFGFRRRCRLRARRGTHVICSGSGALASGRHAQACTRACAGQNWVLLENAGLAAGHGGGRHIISQDGCCKLVVGRCLFLRVAKIVTD